MLFLVVTFWTVSTVGSIELTFELPDNERQCFYEELKAGVENILEYQVSIWHQDTFYKGKPKEEFEQASDL